jgi:hypothetical protein
MTGMTFGPVSNQQITLYIVRHFAKPSGRKGEPVFKTGIFVPDKRPVKSEDNTHKKRIGCDKVEKANPAHDVLFGGKGMDKGIADVIARN